MADKLKQLDHGLKTRRNEHFETIANNLVPTLRRWTRCPRAIVRFNLESAEFFNVRPSAIADSIDKLPTIPWGKGADFVLDFGLHMVGRLSFKLNSVGDHMDAPCRLRLTFGEVPTDVTMDMSNVKTWISTSWLPDEVINIDICPATVRLSRRHAFRYLRIEVIDTSPKYKVQLSEVSCDCVSAIGQGHSVDAVAWQDPTLRAIDHVSISTLRDCMQTVFEDGPRRDQRLWMGDLRLQALSNYCTFKDYVLVKRCLYQFAAFPRDDGSLPACVFEQPTLGPSTDYIVDYDALFCATLYDYVVASGDLETGHDLWGTVDGCLKRALGHLNPETHVFEECRGEGWKFLDWSQDLEHSAGMHGLLLYCLKRANRLAALLGKPETYGDKVTEMTVAATRFLSGESENFVFVSGPNNQISYASAAWLVLSDALPVDTARVALLNTIHHVGALRPLTPYLWHYVCEALAGVGCYDECLKLIKDYWGGMVEAGADTFWECFDPKDYKASPYGDVRNNSFCHAWSCTPSYLLREVCKGHVGPAQTTPVSMADWDDLWIKRTQSNLVGK